MASSTWRVSSARARLSAGFGPFPDPTVQRQTRKINARAGEKQRLPALRVLRQIKVGMAADIRQ
jgi:hypothetical protein